MTLSSEAVERFFEQGYLVHEAVFSEDELKPIRACFERLYARGQELEAKTGIYEGARFVFEGPVLHRVVWGGALEPELLAMADDPRIQGPALQLLGSTQAAQLLNQCHFKMPGDGVAFAWHQDSQHRKYGTEHWTDVNGRGSFVQTILTVDPAPLGSGPLEVFPGSGQRGHLALNERELPSDLGEPLSLAAPAGSVLFFGPYTIHGSQANATERPRRALINGFASPGANRFEYPGSGRGRLVPAGAPA